MSQSVRAVITEIQTRYLIKNRNLFLTVLKAKKFKIQVQTDLQSCESLFPSGLFAVTSHGKRDKRVSSLRPLL